MKVFFKSFFLCILFLSYCVSAQNKVYGVRAWESPERLRLVFDLKEKPKYSYFYLKNPSRLVLDFYETNPSIDLKKLNISKNYIHQVRVSKSTEPKAHRYVVDLAEKLEAKVYHLPPTQPYGYRLVLDFDLTKSRPHIVPKKTTLKPSKRKIIIAVDAGHGGEDPGSVGLKGTFEKKVVLQIAKKLASLINRSEFFSAKMIRTGDYFLKLNSRTEKARKLNADLLISIHADAVFSRQPKGASVWILSTKRANSEIGRWLEQEEKHSDLLGGAAQAIHDAEQEKYLAEALLDMSMDNSRAESFKVAEEVTNQLSKVIVMHKKRPAAASLAVLKSPDIPSLLVETGFISNAQEEKLLKKDKHQYKIAKAIYRAIYNYYSRYPIADTALAYAYSLRRHKVKSGESLMIIANKYGVKLLELKKANRLKNDTILVGQTLKIPKSI
jgi:N-acetylmuramoyl-L-alanine amidase